MDTFNYLAVLISIILGLGITQLLTGLGKVVVARRRIVFYAPTLIWVAMLLLVHIQTWWSMFGLRGHSDWTFVAFVMVLLQPILLYLLSALILPEISPNAQHDLRGHYFDNTRWFFGLFLILLLVSVIKDLVLEGRWPEPTNLGFHGCFFAMSAAAMSTRRPQFHALMPWVTMAAMSAYIGLLFLRLK